MCPGSSLLTELTCMETNLVGKTSEEKELRNFDTSIQIPPFTPRLRGNTGKSKDRRGEIEAHAHKEAFQK
jgi:hypothetical protein